MLNLFKNIILYRIFEMIDVISKNYKGLKMNKKRIMPKKLKYFVSAIVNIEIFLDPKPASHKFLSLGYFILKTLFCEY